VSADDQQQIIDFLNSGKAVYLEGTNIGADNNGTDFWNYFGANYVGMGADHNEVTSLEGVSETFAEDFQFEYLAGDEYCGLRVNRLSANSGDELFLSQNNFARVIANSSSNYHTIASSVIFGAFINNDGINYKYNVMECYLSYLLEIDEQNLWISQQEINFGTTTPGNPQTESIYLQNTGQNVLEISSISLNGDGFNYSGPSSINLEFGQSIELEIEFPATVPGSFIGTLTLLSNDPDLPELVIDLTGECYDYPAIFVVQNELTGTLPSGNTSTTTLSIQNTGGGYLHYVLDPNEIVMRGSGGPDAYGHTWSDSNEPDGPQFVWNDISSIGEDIGLEGVDDFVEVDLPIYFRFYGEEKSSVKISTNGYITFGEDGEDHTNDPIPYAIEPNDFIAPLWDDLRTGDDSYCYTYFDEEEASFTIQWQDWKFYTGGGSGELYFQTKLYESGDIYFYYCFLDGSLTSLTVGIEDSTATDGLQIAYNEEYLENLLAVRISHNPQWLQFDSWTGYIFSGEQKDISVSFDATNLIEGTYSATLQILSDDPDQPVTEIPVNIQVDPAGAGEEPVPLVTALKSNYPNPFNPSTTISFELNAENIENIEIEIFNLKGQKVKILVNEKLDAGTHHVIWNGKDENGKPVSSGVYFYQMKAGKFVSTKKMILMK